MKNASLAPTTSLPLASLRAIKSIRQTGSLSLTAKHLGLTQSAISRSVATLEKHTGTALLRRGSRPIALTTEGDLVADCADAVEQEMLALETRLEDLRKHRSGRLTIGSFGASASSQLLPQLLKKFNRQHPDIAVSVIDANDRQTADALHNEEIDFAVLGKPPKDCECLVMARDQLLALVPLEHPLAKRRKLRAEDFDLQVFVMSQAGSEPQIRQWLAGADATPEIRYQVHQINGILALVQAGLALSIVAEMVLPAHHAEVAAIPLEPTVPREIVMSRLPKQARSQAASCFWEFCKRQF